MAYSYHKQDSYFGNRKYDIAHRSFYSNLVYNSIISDSRHKVKTGISFSHDAYVEFVNAFNYSRIENSLGGFFEYSFDNLDDLNLTAGVRVDYHNLMGTFVTPRLHARYTPWAKSALRFSLAVENVRPIFLQRIKSSLRLHEALIFWIVMALFMA